MNKLILPRRKFLVGLASALAAPAIVRASSLMPIKVLAEETIVFEVGAGWYRLSAVSIGGQLLWSSEARGQICNGDTITIDCGDQMITLT